MTHPVVLMIRRTILSAIRSEAYKLFKDSTLELREVFVVCHLICENSWLRFAVGRKILNVNDRCRRL